MSGTWHGMTWRRDEPHFSTGVVLVFLLVALVVVLGLAERRQQGRCARLAARATTWQDTLAVAAVYSCGWVAR